MHVLSVSSFRLVHCRLYSLMFHFPAIVLLPNSDALSTILGG